MERNFKGIWIPKEVWLSKDLTTIEKLFLVEIDSLDNKDGCFASNKYFAEFFGISKGRCTQIIKSLESKMFVNITLIREGKQVVKRLIRVVNKLNNPSKYSKQPYLENAQDNNTSISNTERETKFLSLFNERKKLKFGKSNFKVLSKTDKNNLKQLLGYSFKDFKTAIDVMLENEWAKSTNNQTPTHILRVENFNRYLSAGEKVKTQEETDEERVKRLTEEAKGQ
jgi:hypothetical protein